MTHDPFAGNDIWNRPRFLRDILWAFFDTKATETFILDEDRTRLVEEGILRKGSDGRYLITEKGKDMIEKDHHLFEHWSGIIR
jgi:hypothetical protein